MNEYAVCFDLDGVISNSEPTHERAFKKALAQCNITLSHEEYTTYFAGKTDRRGFEDFLKAHHQTSLRDIPTLLTNKASLYAQVAPSTLQPYTETINTIRELYRQHVTMALVTSSVRSEATLAMQACHITNTFDAIVTGDDIPFGKPDPLPYLTAAERLHTAPGHCLAIEDSPNGILSAKRAGMWCIAVTTTHSSEVLEPADMIVSITDLQQAIEEVLKQVSDYPLA